MFQAIAMNDLGHEMSCHYDTLGDIAASCVTRYHNEHPITRKGKMP